LASLALGQQVFIEKTHNLVRKNMNDSAFLPAAIFATLGSPSVQFKTERPIAVTDKTQHWTQRLSKSLPQREALSAHPWLQPVASQLLHPQLWRLQHEAVARGVAVGTFWAFALPFAQILAAAAHCTWWRANIPVAAAVTMVTNPLTIGFWLWLAYQAGALVLGQPTAQNLPLGGGVPSWLAEFGWPTLLGMGLFAVGGAAVGYLGVKVIWRLRVLVKRRARRARL
jgi:uncharacterized protein (DUF2062 family)